MKLYLRQGEGDDYLIHPTDRAAEQRPYVRKISPYNLTATGLNYNVNILDMSTSRAGIFTEFPTQSGFKSLWGGCLSGGIKGWLRVYSPFTSTMGSDPNNQTWDADKETCPIGYRRPTFTTYSISATTTSEFGQSLWVNPAVTDCSNSVGGVYADGFFDRTLIGINLSESLWSYGYGYDTNQYAFAGRLVYNNIAGSSRKNASIFFPSSGAMDYGLSGIDFWPVSAGLYYTSSGSSHSYSLLFVDCIRIGSGWFTIEQVSSTYFSGDLGLRVLGSVRCVVDE